MGETCGSGSGVIQHLEVRGWEGKDNEEDPASETKGAAVTKEHSMLGAK